MPSGRIKRLVHLSQQRFLPNTRAVPDHNDKGYGVIEAEDGQEVFFPHEAVESRSGFEDVRLDQIVDYRLEAAPYLRRELVEAAGQCDAERGALVATEDAGCRCQAI